jgi:hypothetical protein
MNQKAFQIVSSFWAFLTQDISVFFNIHETLTATRAKWEEGISENPNSYLFCEGYASFLLDSATDFYSAIFQIHRKNLIVDGHTFSVDHSFRSLVYSFPFYLRNNILDLLGNIRNQNKAKSEKSSQNNPFSEFDLNEIDDEEQTAIAESLLSEPKIRLAFQKLT